MEDDFLICDIFDSESLGERCDGKISALLILLLCDEKLLDFMLNYAVPFRLSVEEIAHFRAETVDLSQREVEVGRDFLVAETRVEIHLEELCE